MLYASPFGLWGPYLPFGSLTGYYCVVYPTQKFHPFWLFGLFCVFPVLLCTGTVPVGFSNAHRKYNYYKRKCSAGRASTLRKRAMAAAMLAPPRIFLSLNGWTDGSCALVTVGALETPMIIRHRPDLPYSIPPCCTVVIRGTSIRMSWPP